MAQTGYNTYRTANVETTDQGKLIIMVYDWAIRHCKMANEKLKVKDVEGRANTLLKAQNAITELMVSLNMEKGGDLSQRLYSLYDYMNRRLIEANIKNTSAPIEEVLKYLLDLREAWVISIKKVREQKSENTAADPSAGLAMVG
jgi:flagellar protein FliS